MEFQGMCDVEQEKPVDTDAGGAPEPYQHQQSATGAVKREGAPFSAAPGAAPVKAETDTGMDVDDEGMPPQAARHSPPQSGTGPSPPQDAADGSRSSSASEEILPDRRAAAALPLEKVDVGSLSLHHHNDSASEPPSAADPDPLELDEASEAGGEAKVVEERKERTTRQRRTVARPAAQGTHAHSEDSYDDCSSSEEEEMRKTIMIGSAYQAVVPEGFTKYADKPYKHNDKLLWEPRSGLPSDAIDLYLQTSQAMADSVASADGLDLMPMGAHVRDDEQALFQLMQCNHNVEEALRKRHSASPGPPGAAASTPWTDEECREFENGILTFGKDFHAIQAQRVRTRTVSEIVQFYYLWKKTERHDIFANKMRPEKKKYMLHPGVTLVVYELLDKENQKDATSRDAVTA
ncbi:mesoderm induction early response protein 1-like [Thrips palmi]|uniref:Mesoderm induction early response protein 1-like n=1 Tax=Thrips palmi TaxID=161013 RepID=A0A6P8Z107_THRPL|nr:mesoderm induction early response protein 1-like [Thrips palmi]